MSQDVIFLEVLSVNNQVVDADTRSFVVARMSGIKDNANPEKQVTITEAGDTGTVLSEWKVDVGLGSYIYEGLRLYWKFTSNGTTRTVSLYASKDPISLVATGSLTIANGASGIIRFKGVNDITLNGTVKATIAGGGSTDDVDDGNTLTFTDVIKTRGLGVPGASQFMYAEGVERQVKYTVTKTVNEIEAAIKSS